MAKLKFDSIERKRYYNSRRSNFKRKFVNEKNKINQKISDLRNKCDNVESCALVRDENDRSADFLQSKLRDWALHYNIRTYCLRNLLKILVDNGVPFLSTNPAKFLHTPNTIEIEYIANGQFWYSGIENNLRKLLQTADKSIKLELNFHVDGLQLFKSSTKQFWPIQCQVHGKQNLYN